MATTHPLTLQDYNFELPSELIAQEPARPRDHSRLLVLHRAESGSYDGDTLEQTKGGKDAVIEHKHFYDISDYLQAGDVLVINTSKVIKARLHGTKPTGGVVEIFLLAPLEKQRWQCLVKGSVKPGMTITIHDDVHAVMIQPVEEMWEVSFNTTDITRYGEVPLPPYIKQPDKQSTAAKTIESDYQTVYAQESGSVAAPTAGLHFTEKLLHKLQDKGVVVAPVILHVGLGTFAAVKTEDITQHTMHAEYAILPPATANAIAAAKAGGHTVMAVGTTACRTLEAFSAKGGSQPKADQPLAGAKTYGGHGWVDIFIYPGYTFNTVDALITNFHLPKTTLLMLVSALAGKSNIDRAYAEAIKERYRFFSFGDAMLIL